MSLGYPHPVSQASAPPRAQVQQRHSYPPSIDIRHPPGPAVHPVPVGGAGTSAPRPSAPAGANMPLQQPPNPPTPSQRVSSSVHPDTYRAPTTPISAPISAPPPELASLLHPAVDLQAIQHKMEGTLSQVGINLGAIWRHIVETTTLEAAKHRSDALRWKERSLHFEEMYKNCKQKLDNMNHDNIMLQTQIGRSQAELTRVRGQGRPVGPSSQVTRHHGAITSRGQDHVARGRAQTVSSLHPTPASTVEELPPPPHIQGTSTTPLREKLVIDLSNDREDVEMISQNESLSALCTTGGPHPDIPPTAAVCLPTPPEQCTSTITPQISSPEVPTRETTSPKSSRVTPPLVAHGVSGLLSSKPSSTIRTVTPLKPRSNVNDSTLTMAPILGTLPTAVVLPVQAPKPATSPYVNEPEEELEEGEVKSDSPLASPMNGRAVQKGQLRNPSHTAARAGSVKNVPSNPDSVPPLSLYFKPNQPIPPIPKNIPKKRPLEVVVEHPIKKARPVLPPSDMGLPKRQTNIASRSTTASSRPGTAERASTQGSEGVPKPEPKSPVLPPSASAPSRPMSTEVAASTVKPANEDTAVTESNPRSDMRGARSSSWLL